MDFASNTFDADGRAAFAMVVATIQTLKLKGVLEDADGVQILETALALMPNGHGRLDAEARTLVEDLRNVAL